MRFRVSPLAPILLRSQERSLLKAALILYTQPLAIKNLIPNEKGTAGFVDRVHESTSPLIVFLVNVRELDYLSIVYLIES